MIDGVYRALLLLPFTFYGQTQCSPESVTDLAQHPKIALLLPHRFVHPV